MTNVFHIIFFMLILIWMDFLQISLQKRKNIVESLSTLQKNLKKSKFLKKCLVIIL